MFVILFIFTLIALLAYFTIYAKNYAYMLEPYNNNSFSETQHFKRYIANIHPNQYKNKLVGTDFNRIRDKSDFFQKKYIKSLEPIDAKYLSMLNHYIAKIKILLIKNGLNNLTKYKWSFLQSVNNLEDNMPYTIDRFIIFSKKSLEKQYDKFIRGSNDDKRFLETLIHEQIHVIQRANQNYFNNTYSSIFNFLLTKISIEDLPEYLKKINMTNPDSNFDIWIYKINGKDYYPILEKTDLGYEDKGYRNNESIDLFEFKTNLGYKHNVSFYHPNEILACVLSDQIMNYRVERKYIDTMIKI